MAVIACPLREMALERPEAPALIVNQEPVSYAMLDSQVEQYRLALGHEGLRQGDRLLVLTTDPVKTITLLLACLRSRWVFCPFNPGFPPSQIADYCSRTNIRHITCVPKGMALPAQLNVINVPELNSDSFMQSGAPLNLELDAVCDLIATSGTTGTPKAVVHSLRNHIASAKASQKMIPLNTEDCWLLSLPLFHVGGLGVVFRCLINGASLLIDTHKTPLSDLLNGEVTRGISGPAVSHVSLVNTQLYRLLNSVHFDLQRSGLKCILLGGGAATPGLVKKVQGAGVQILTTYGMTEMSSQVCTGVPEFVDSGVTSGTMLPHCEVKIDCSGEILVRGQSLCLGYFRQGLIESVCDESGWYHTGDKGEWVGEQLKVTGRLDNMFISGGENIHPEEIEQALLSIDGMVQAVVVAMHDEQFGQRPFAFVQFPEESFDENAIKQQLEGFLSRFKIPERIELFPPSVVQNALKPNRKHLQELVEKRTVL